MQEGPAGFNPPDIVGQATGKVIEAGQHMSDADGNQRQSAVAREKSLGLPFARGIAGLGEIRIVPRIP